MNEFRKQLINQYVKEDHKNLDVFRQLRGRSEIETASFRQYCETLALSTLYLGMCNATTAIKDTEFYDFFATSKLPITKILTPSIVIHNLHGLPSTKARLHQTLKRHFGGVTSISNLDKILQKGIEQNVLKKVYGVDHNNDGIKDSRTAHYLFNHEKIEPWLDFLRAVTHLNTGLYYREGSHMIWTQDEHLALMSFSNYVIHIDNWDDYLQYEAKVEHDAAIGDNPELLASSDSFTEGYGY